MLERIVPMGPRWGTLRPETGLVTSTEWHPESVASLMETRQHLTRAVGTAPEYEVPPHAGESWGHGQVVLSASFKSALSGGSRTQSKIRCQNAESQDLGLEDKDLPSLEWLLGQTGERKSFSAACLCSSFPGSKVRMCRFLCVGDRYCEAHWRYSYAEGG